MRNHTNRMLWTKVFVAGAITCLLSSVASAQDYTVTRRDSTYHAPPADAVDPLLLPNGLRRIAGMVDLPFTFLYYGYAYDEIWICKYGFVQLGTPLGSESGANGFFPPDGSGEGMLAVAWDERSGLNGRKVMWTEGTAPNRVLYVSWEDWQLEYQSGKEATCQIQLYEGSGRIVFAYEAGGTAWDGAGYSLGIDAPGGDSRYVAPLGTFDRLGGDPGQDIVFDPEIKEVSGVAAYDRVRAGGGGVSATVDADVALAGVRIELLRGLKLAAVTVTDDDGAYVLTVASPSDGASGSVRVVARTASGVVRAAATSAPHSVTMDSSVSLGADIDLGTISVGSTEDASGVGRAALHVTQVIRGLHAIVADAGTDLPPLEVLYDRSSTAGSGYTAGDEENAAVMRVASSFSGDEDGWDRDVIARTYARHVLANIAVPSTTTARYGYDSVTDAENAFAEAFGAYLAALADGDDVFTDAVDEDSGSEWSLETPDFESEPAPDVAGWIAAMLFDLTDAANEVIDRIDGTGSNRLRVLELIDGRTAAPTSGTFMTTWVEAGLDPIPLVRSYVYHGLLRDDALEPNDDDAEATDLGTEGVRREKLVLNRFNSDWFEITLPYASHSLAAEVVFRRAMMQAGVAVEILSAGGASLALTTVTSDDSGLGPIRATSGAVPAGRYRVRVTHLGGDPVTDYAVQVLPALTLSREPFRDWTLGRPYEQVLALQGGIQPYVITDSPLGGRPPGLVLDAAGKVLRGTPSAAGRFSFTVSVTDAGTPLHSLAQTYEMVINDALQLDLSGFVAFPAGRPFDVTYPHLGGTAPLKFAITDGALPGGVSMDTGGVRLHGIAAAPGMTTMTIDAVDVAGSADQARVAAVACAALTGKKTPVPLAADASATGFFVDAVAGSRIDIGVTTAKKRPKRRLALLVLGPDGRVRADAKYKGANGKASLKKLIADATGRYFVVVTAEGGEETELLGTPKVKPPKSGKGAAPDVEVGQTIKIEIGALAGAKLKLKLKPARRSGLVIRVQSLISPSGAAVPHADLVSQKGSALTLRTTLGESGTWTVSVFAQSGSAADVSWSYKLKQPKGAAYTDD